MKHSTYVIPVGAKFYHNNYSTANGQSIPDYLIVLENKNGFITAKYENHYVYTKERTFSESNLYASSNLNPRQKKPEWIFLKSR